jgi:phenylacetate-CoA ligase
MNVNLKKRLEIMMRILRAAYLLYRLSLVCIQNLAISFYGFVIYLQRYTRTYHQYLKLYRSRDYSSYKKNRQFQNREFIKLLHYAVRHSEYYRELYQDIDLSRIKSVKEIDRLPILTKEAFKENVNKLYSITTSKGIKLHTGGTTGVPISILVRRSDLQKRLAYLDAFKLEYGFQANKMRCARFTGKNIILNMPRNHIYWRDNYISKQRYYSTYHLTDQNMLYYVNNLNMYRPEAIDGFVSAIYLLAKYINDNHLVLTFTPRAVFTTSETVLPLHRELIERVFQCPLRDQYASNDGAPFIKQCSCGTYHENIDTGVFEHVKTSRGVKLLVTSFFSYGTPLIRYDIGDYILESEREACPCGSCHPIIAAIDGRTTDYLRTKTRGNISQAALSVLISELPDCFEQLQLLQVNSQVIHVKVIMKEAYRLEEYQSLLMDQLIRYLGNDMELKIERVACIEREKSGKFRMIINRMEEVK